MSDHDAFQTDDEMVAWFEVRGEAMHRSLPAASELARGGTVDLVIELETAVQTNGGSSGTVGEIDLYMQPVVVGD